MKQKKKGCKTKSLDDYLKEALEQFPRIKLTKNQVNKIAQKVADYHKKKTENE